MKASGIIPVVLSSCVNQKQPGSLLKMEVLLQGLCRFGLRGLGRVLEISIFHKVLHACELTVKVVQLCLTLCDSRDYTVHGILQARILEWVAFPFSRGSNPSLPHCRRILYQLSHKGSPSKWCCSPNIRSTPPSPIRFEELESPACPSSFLPLG